MLKDLAKATERSAQDQRVAQIQPLYLKTVTLVERVHRRLLEVIKDEFDRRNRADINAIQALLLYNIDEQEITAGELRTLRATLYHKHVSTVEQVGDIYSEDFVTLNKSLHRLERFWTDQILYRL